MSVVYGKQPAQTTRTGALRQFRRTYPYRLVREHSLEPRPERVDTEVYGDFARFPTPAGDEWLFMTEAARDRFIEEYGGTALPVLEILPDGTIKAPSVSTGPRLPGATTAAISRHLRHISLPPVGEGLSRVSKKLDERLARRKDQ